MSRVFFDQSQFVYRLVQDVLSDVRCDAAWTHTHAHYMRFAPIARLSMVEGGQPRAMPRRKQLALKHCTSCLFAARSVTSACVRRATGSTHTHTERFSHRRRRQSRDDGGRPALIGKLTDGLALRIFGGNVCAGSSQQPYDLRVCVPPFGGGTWFKMVVCLRCMRARMFLIVALRRRP